MASPPAKEGYAAAYDSLNWTCYEDGLTITSVSDGDPEVFTLTSHGLVDDDVVVVGSLTGYAPSGGAPVITGVALLVDNATTNTFTLKFRSDNVAIDASDYDAWTAMVLHEERFGSEFIHSRLTPYTTHSSLNISRRNGTYRSAGDYAVLCGVQGQTTFDNAFFACAKAALHMLSEDPGAAKQGWENGKFHMHHEGASGGSTQRSMQFESIDSSTDYYVKNCVIEENASDCTLGFFRTDGADNVYFEGGKIAIIRLKSNFSATGFLHTVPLRFHFSGVDLQMPVAGMNADKDQFSGTYQDPLTSEFIRAPSRSTATLDTNGDFTVTAQFMTIDTFEAAATDSVNDINFPTHWPDDIPVMLKSANNARDITLDHGGGNIRCAGLADQVLDSTNDTVVCFKRGSVVVTMPLSNAGA